MSIKKNKKATLSLLLLYYLENNKVEKARKEKFELFIIYHLFDVFLLNEYQKVMYKKVRSNVSVSVKKYIKKWAP